LLQPKEDQEQQARFEQLAKILSGTVTIELHLQFLIRTNHTDMLILKATKDAIRVSICHTATVIANAFMHSGTTSDQFLRYSFLYCCSLHDSYTILTGRIWIGLPEPPTGPS
jgi:hypothetical protein